MNAKEFDVLLTCFQKYYRPKQKNPYTNVYNPVLTDPGEALFFFLHYYKAYPTLENMGLYFDIYVKTACNRLDHTKARSRPPCTSWGWARSGL
jgi:hypothetical protein